MSVKAIALLSGGLDSTLAVKLMLDQGIEVAALNFMTPFCTCTGKSSSCKHEALRVAKEFGVPIKVKYKGMDYLKLVQNAPHGYGRGINPCIDCRIFMHAQAKELMAEEGASFIVTGEVLGQRPMSQRRHTLALIDKESATQDLVLRPLSAQHFEPTLPEREGWVDREKLLAIHGRSRKEQIQLAKDKGIADYPCPAGGCLLTNVEFAAKLRDLFDNKADYDLKDVRLLKIGRHFRLHPGLKIIVGRDEAENSSLEKSMQDNDVLVYCSSFTGPFAFIREEASEDDIKTAGRILLRYGHEEQGSVSVNQAGTEKIVEVSGPASDEEIEAMRIGARKK